MPEARPDDRSVVPAILVHSVGNLALALGGVLYASLPRLWPTLFSR